MSGNATHRMRIHYLRLGATDPALSVNELCRIEPADHPYTTCDLNTHTPYKDVNISADAIIETYDSIAHKLRLNYTPKADISTALHSGKGLILLEDVTDYFGRTVKAGSGIIAQYTRQIRLLDGSRRTGQLYGISAINDPRLFLGHFSTIPLESGMTFEILDDNEIAAPDAEPAINSFIRGARIKTPHGLITVEDLKSGDLVLTRHNGFQPLRWIGSTAISNSTMKADRRRCPVRIRAGSLGPNIPVKSCYFSQQQRILLNKPDQTGSFLTPIKELIGMPGIELADDWHGDIEYFYLVFDQHEIVLSDEAQTESKAMTELPQSTTNEIEKLRLLAFLPEVADMKPARRILSDKEAQELISKMTEGGMPLQDNPDFTDLA